MSTNNLEIWDKVKEPPPWALKEITFGKLKGKSDINPQWRWLAMTEAFGMCGVGWYYEISDHWTVQQDSETMCFVKVNLYVKDGQNWSKPIPAIGGDFIIEKDKNGLHGNDDVYKMAVTDALGKAMTFLGVAANVYHGSKYTRKKDDIDHKKALKDYIDLGIREGYKTACEKWLSDNLEDKTIDSLSNEICGTWLAILKKDSVSFIKDKPIETATPEVEQPGFTPYVKGGENVKAKETPVEALKTAQKGAVPSILETSAKLKAEYLVSISNLKTLDNCKYLGDDMTKKAGQLTEADRTELKAKFAEKKGEIKAATNPDKAPEAPAKEPEILNEGDKVKVEVNGKVVIKGTIEKFGIVGGRRTVKLKESATPVFADLCTKE